MFSVQITLLISVYVHKHLTSSLHFLFHHTLAGLLCLIGRFTQNNLINVPAELRLPARHLVLCVSC